MEALTALLQEKLFQEFKTHKSRSQVYFSARKLAKENNLPVHSLYNETLMRRCDNYDSTPSKGILSRCWLY